MRHYFKKLTFTLREGVGTPEVMAWLRRAANITERELDMWHYQMRVRKDKDQEIFEMVEVYPAVEGEYPKLWSKNGITPCGETQEELIEDLTHMLEDAKRYPVFVDNTQEEDDAVHQGAGSEDPEQAASPIEDLKPEAGGASLPHL